MQVEFAKYRAAGNDFIVIDNRKGLFVPSKELVISLCRRRFGIGADGLLVIEDSAKYGFKVQYFSSNGNELTLTANGGCCVAHFALSVGIAPQVSNYMFESIGDVYSADVQANKVILTLPYVVALEEVDDCYFVNLGSPQYALFVHDVSTIDVANEGRIVSKSVVSHAGTNVNFVQCINPETIKLRTFDGNAIAECPPNGEGVIMSALAYTHYFEPETSKTTVITADGQYEVGFTFDEINTFSDIKLEGEVKFIFKGEVDICSFIS